jgi:NHL repeat-containing protein
MRLVLGSLLMLSSAFALPATGLTAEAAKLRYLAAIYLDDKGGGMRQPEGVACNDKSTLIVADTGNGRLLRYMVDDQSAKPVGEMAAPQLSSPIRVQMNSKGEVFALDGKQRRVVRFDAKGEAKGYLAPEGVPEPATIVPRSLAIDRADAIYLLDVFGARVLVLDAGGKYQRQIPFPPNSGFFSDVAVDAKGEIYLLDSVKATVYSAQKDAKAFSILGKPLRAQASFPTSLTLDARGVLYVVDENGSGVVMVGRGGSVLGRQLAMGWTDGLVYYPSQLCLNDKGQVFVADRGNSRVQMFSIAR